MFAVSVLLVLKFQRPFETCQNCMIRRIVSSV